MKNFVRCALVLSFAACNLSFAAAAPAFYRCKDAQGKLHSSSSMPEACRGRDTEVLNAKGSVINVIESDATKAKTQEREAEETRLLKERNQLLQRDRVLLDTYLTVSDIERLRDQRLELLEAQLKVAEQHIVTLQERLNQLRQQSARFRPYNEALTAPPLPDHLAEALVITVKSVAVDRETMQNKKTEQMELAASFDRDIKRFKELKSLK